MANPFKTFGKALGAIAPTAAKLAARSTPLGGVVLDLVGDKLGIDDKNPNVLAGALDNLSPEDKIKIAEVEAWAKVEDSREDTKKLEIETKDKQSARDIFGDNPWVIGLAYLLVICFMGIVVFILHTVLEEDREISAVGGNLIFSIVSYMAGFVSAVVTFFFGPMALKKIMNNNA